MGIIRGINTILIVSAMAFGIVIAIRVCGIDNFVKDLSMTPHHTYWEYAIAAAISAMGFATIFNFPPKQSWILALGGIVAICTELYQPRRQFAKHRTRLGTCYRFVSRRIAREYHLY